MTDNFTPAPVRTPRPGRQAPPAKPIKSGKSDRTTIALLFIAALVAVGGIGFAVGHVTANSAPANTAATRNGFGGRGGAFASLAPGQTFNLSQFGGGGGRGALGGTVTGTVQSIDGSTMTVQLTGGTTVTIDLATGTTYHNETAGSSTDVKTGSTVLVQIDTAAAAGVTPVPGASGTRSVTAKDVLITTP